MPPKITAINVDKTSGILPFTVKATVDAKDPEKDKLTYIWDLGNGTTKETTTPELDYTYTTAGDYKISVTVKDGRVLLQKAMQLNVYAGNETPVVNIQLTAEVTNHFIAGKTDKLFSISNR